MGEVQQWAWSLCLLILISTILQYVMPGGTMQRSMKLVLGGFVVLGMIQPAASLAQSADWSVSIAVDDTTAEHYLEQANDRILSQARANVSAVIAEKLTQLGVQAENITVEMDTDADNCIVIDKAVIGLHASDADKAEQLRQAVWSSLGIQTEVVINGG